MIGASLEEFMECQFDPFPDTCLSSSCSAQDEASQDPIILLLEVIARPLITGDAVSLANFSDKGGWNLLAQLATQTRKPRGNSIRAKTDLHERNLIFLSRCFFLSSSQCLAESMK